jgi:ERF superfamily
VPAATKSPSVHASLHEALLAFQASAPKLLKQSQAVVKSQKGSYSYKYVDLADIMEQVGPLLAQHGLTWSTFPCRDERGDPALRYVLTHAGTGDCMTETMPLMIAQATAQGLGSAITYARRYSLCAVLNLVADEDDDGQAATGSGRTPSAAGRQEAAVASLEQRRLLFAKADEAQLPPTEFADAICKAVGIGLRSFDDESHASAWVSRQVDRLPARLVDRVLDEIRVLAAQAHEPDPVAPELR